MLTRNTLLSAIGLKPSPLPSISESPNASIALLGPPSEESNTPAVLALSVIDTSGSIYPHADDLRGGHSEYYSVLKSDDLNAVSVITASILVSTGIKVFPFQPVVDFRIPTITIGGGTDLGLGMNKAVDLIEAEMTRLAAAGRPLNKVALTLITDGKADDDTTIAIQRWKKLEQLPSVSIFPIAVGDEAFAFLSQVTSKTEPARLKNESGSFTQLLRWLADVVSTYSRSRPGQDVKLPATDSWKEER